MLPDPILWAARLRPVAQEGGAGGPCAPPPSAADRQRDQNREAGKRRLQLDQEGRQVRHGEHDVREAEEIRHHAVLEKIIWGVSTT